MRQYICQSKLSTTKAEEANGQLVPKKQRYYLIWNNSVTLLSAVLVQHKFTFFYIFKLFSNRQHALLQSTQSILQSPTTEHGGFWTLVLIQ